MTNKPNIAIEPIHSIQPFIDLEYHTVPLNGKSIKRDSKGSKHGFSFPKDWQKVYSETLNELPTPLGGLLTGKGGIVAIDCDCDRSWKLFRSLDPTYTAYFKSVGKLTKDGEPIDCGTILYRHQDSLPPSKRIGDTYNIDYYNGTGMVFLPTAKNASKASWMEDEEGNLYNHNGDLVQIHDMPFAVSEFLSAIFKAPIEKSASTTVRATRAKGFLGRLLPDLEMELGEYNPKVTKILTPHEYRNDLYKKQGHISPKDVGVRHDYLFKIFCTLAGDNTVDQDLAIDTLHYINSLMEVPKPHKKLDTEIIAGIVSGRQKNSQGEPYWQYDENWEVNQGWTVTSKTEGDMCDVFYDDKKKLYFIYDTVSDELEQFKSFPILRDHIDAWSMEGSDGWKISQRDMRNVVTVVEPLEDFGYIENDRRFNRFEPTEALRVLHDPKSYESDYIEPLEFIAYMEHFIPDEQQRGYFLSLIRTKLTTFKSSAVIPYIIGVQGSGKGLLMNVIEGLIGKQYIGKEVTGATLLSQFNKWLENKYFINLNELAEALSTKTERNKASGALKTYSGATSFNCEGKGDNQYDAPMTAMFIMTANRNPLPVEDTDRRIYYISTPNTFVSNPMCVASKDATIIYDNIIAQIKDIAYYLATEVKNVSNNDYKNAPHHEGRETILFDSKVPSQKIAWALKEGQFKLLEDYLLNSSGVFSHHADNKVFLDDLADAYSEMVASDDPHRVMKNAMKDNGFIQKQGTKNAVYWKIDNFSDYDFSLGIEEDKQAEDIRL